MSTNNDLVAKPMPRINAVNRPFFNGCNDDKLVIQRCKNSGCRMYIYYPRVCCPSCGTGNPDWVEVKGDGFIVSNTTIYRSHHESFNAITPYVFAAVRLTEGPILYGMIVATQNFDVSLVGKKVKANFEQHSKEQKLLSFKLLE